MIAVETVLPHETRLFPQTQRRGQITSIAGIMPIKAISTEGPGANPEGCLAAMCLIQLGTKVNSLQNLLRVTREPLTDMEGGYCPKDPRPFTNKAVASGQLAQVPGYSWQKGSCWFC